jgi:hypothetical protein
MIFSVAALLGRTKIPKYSKGYDHPNPIEKHKQVRSDPM